jgi:hypothetical protein
MQLQCQLNQVGIVRFNFTWKKFELHKIKDIFNYHTL